MTKNDTVESIITAKENHELQMKKIEDAMDGVEIQEPTALNKMECDFGKWLYSKEYHMKEILGSQFYIALDVEHEKWHNEYAKIYKILFQENHKKGLFSKLLGKHKIDPLELDKVKLYYAELQITSEKLLKVLGSCQRRIIALPESKFH